MKTAGGVTEKKTHSLSSKISKKKCNFGDSKSMFVSESIFGISSNGEM